MKPVLKAYTSPAAMLIVFWLLFPLVSCDRCGTAPEQEERVYGYRASDSTGTRVAEGLIYLTYLDSLVLGHWSIDEIGSPGAIGPQTGSDNLEGMKMGDSLWIELRPEWRDNNVMLVGRISEASFDGRWIYSSLIGITASGTFSAPRIVYMDCIR